MIELLLCNEERGGVPSGVPEIDDDLCVINSGPGPQCLIGYDETDDAGFFGEIPSSHFITSGQISQELSFTAGLLKEDVVSWLKFWIDGNVVFIPIKSLRYNVSWNDIAANNLVYGETIINIGNFLYRVKLIEMYNPGTSRTPQGGFNIPTCQFSQWNRLLWRVVSDYKTPKVNQIGPNWADYSQGESGLGMADFLDGAGCWGKENINNQVSRCGNGEVNWCWPESPTMREPRFGWRPLLELVQEL